MKAGVEEKKLLASRIHPAEQSVGTVRDRAVYICIEVWKIKKIKTISLVHSCKTAQDIKFSCELSC